MRAGVPTCATLAAVLLAAACSNETPGTVVRGRLAFLLARDATRAYVIDSGFDPLFVGVGPLDPPYEPGLNKLTVLGGVDSELFVEQTIDPGEGTAVVFGLSPDGDIALVGTKLPPRWELAIVRGLRVGPAHVALRMPLPWLPSAFAFSPDGTTAYVGSGHQESLLVAVVGGLPDSPELIRTIELGVSGKIHASASSLDMSLDGSRLLVQSVVQDTLESPESFLLRPLIQVVKDPAGEVPEVSVPLALPTSPALPAQPPFEGLPTGIALGDSAILGDGDSAIVPCSGSLDLGQPDARIFLVRGIRNGDLQIARTLTPDDGVRPSPFQVSLFPGGDRALVSNTLDASVTVVSGLSEPGFASVLLETFPVLRSPAAEPSVTPDGRALVILHKQSPVDGSQPAAVSNYSLVGGVVTPAGMPLNGPVRAPPYWKDATLETFQPGLSDNLHALSESLPAPTGESLQSRIDVAIWHADHGRDSEAIGQLLAFQEEVRGLEAIHELSPGGARMLDTLAQVAVKRLE